jgi:hypothetical protein
VRPSASLLLVVPALALCAPGCGGGAAAPFGVASFVVGIDHPYFPLVRGRTWVYAGEDEGAVRDEVVRSLDETRTVLGVRCTGLRQEVHLDGVLDEVTTEWFAQDRQGNVWKFGEESFEDDGGDFVLTADSWMAGVGGMRPWLAFSSDPRVGDRFVGPYPGGQDEYEVVSVTDTVVVPAGTFENCHRVVENVDDPDDTDIILYAADVGRLSESNVDGRIELVEIRQD